MEKFNRGICLIVEMSFFDFFISVEFNIYCILIKQNYLVKKRKRMDFFIHLAEFLPVIMENFGFWSLIPPIIAIVLAIRTKQVYVSLIFGIWLGWVIINGGNPITGTFDTVKAIVDVFQNESSTQTIIFTLLIGSLIAFIQSPVLCLPHWSVILFAQNNIKHQNHCKNWIKIKRNCLEKNRKRMLKTLHNQ